MRDSNKGIPIIYMCLALPNIYRTAYIWKIIAKFGKTLQNVIHVINYFQDSFPGCKKVSKVNIFIRGCSPWICRQCELPTSGIQNKQCSLLSAINWCRLHQGFCTQQQKIIWWIRNKFFYMAQPKKKKKFQCYCSFKENLLIDASFFFYIILTCPVSLTNVRF